MGAGYGMRRRRRRQQQYQPEGNHDDDDEKNKTRASRGRVRKCYNRTGTLLIKKDEKNRQSFSLPSTTTEVFMNNSPSKKSNPASVGFRMPPLPDFAKDHNEENKNKNNSSTQSPDIYKSVSNLYIDMQYMRNIQDGVLDYLTESNTYQAKLQSKIEEMVDYMIKMQHELEQTKAEVKELRGIFDLQRLLDPDMEERMQEAEKRLDENLKSQETSICSSMHAVSEDDDEDFNAFETVREDEYPVD